MLSKKYRFHGYGSLKYVNKNGDKTRDKYFVIKTTTNPKRNHNRVAIVISKKIHKSAVARNRVRRRVYEMVRHELDGVATPHDIVVIVVSPEVRFAPSQELSDSIKRLFDRLGLYK